MRRFMLIGMILLAASVSRPAQAGVLDFTFSFSGTTNVSGTVTGEIFGLTNNTANQAATDVKIASYPAGFTGLPGAPFDVTNQVTDVSANSFTVTNDAITSVDYNGRTSNNSLILELNASDTWDLEDDTTDNWTLNYNGFSGGTFALASASSVPEPSSFAILVVGLGGILGTLSFRPRRGWRT